MIGPTDRSPEQRTALGAFASIEFECSLTAAEANKAAHDFFSHKDNTEVGYKDLYFINDTEPVHTKYYYLDNFDRVGRPSGLALLEPTVKKEQRKPRWLRRDIVYSYDQPGEPVLGVIIDDIAIPLATFARRKDGTCSYVQIGSEIKDDNFHVIASDDISSRNEVVEAIRSYLDTDYKPFQDKNKKHDILQNLFNIELANMTAETETALEALLTRWLEVKLKNDGGNYDVGMINSGSDIAYEEYSVAGLMKSCSFENGHTAWLCVGAPKDNTNPDIINLLAFTRANLAINLADINLSTGQILFANPELTAESHKKIEVVHRLLSVATEPLLNIPKLSDELNNLRQRRVAGLSITKKVRHSLAEFLAEPNEASPKDAKPSFKTRKDQMAAHIFGYDVYRYKNMPILSQEEFEPYDVMLKDQDINRVDLNEMAARLRADLSSGGPSTNPYPDSVICEIAYRRHNALVRERRKIFDYFNVKDLLAEKLGPTSADEQNLAYKIYRMKGTSSGIIPDVDTGATTIDMFIKADVEREGSVFQITVSGKPQAMTDEPLKVFQPFCFSFDASRPIAPQLNGTKEHIDEIMDLLGKLEKV